MQGCGEGELGGIGVLKVDVDVEAAAVVFEEGVREGGVGLRGFRGWGVAEGFAV